MKKKINKNRFIFIATSVVILIIFVFFAIITFSKDKGLNFFGSSYTFAVHRDQELVTEERLLQVGLVKYRKIKKEDIKEGIEVIVHDENRIGDYLWVEEIISVEDNLVTLKYNEYFHSQTLNKDDIKLEYIKTANIFGYMFYVITSEKSFPFLIFYTLAVEACLYVLLINKNRVKREDINYEKKD